jgi:hypothetical protein
MTAQNNAPSRPEIDGRLIALQGQRDNALNTIVLQAGELVWLSDELNTARERFE